MPKSKIDPRRRSKHKKVNRKNPNKAMKQYSRKVKKMSEEKQAEEIYLNAEQMIRNAAAILPLTRNEELRRHGDVRELDELTIIVSKDIKKFHDDLVAIRQQHLEANQNPSKADRLFVYLSIADQYSQLMEQFNVVVTPHMVRLNHMVQYADQQHKGAQL